MSSVHIFTITAGEAREAAGIGGRVKGKVVADEVPLVHLINMLKGKPPKWGLQLEPDQVGELARMHCCASMALALTLIVIDAEAASSHDEGVEG